MIAFLPSCYVLITIQLNMFHSGTKRYKLIFSVLLLEENKMMKEIDDSATLLRIGKYSFFSYCTALTKQSTWIKGSTITGRVTWPDMNDIYRVENVILPQDN